MGAEDICNECKTVVLKVLNKSGMHVRPAGTIVRLFEGSDCEVTFTYGGETVNARSVMSILMLGIPCGGEVEVHFRGKGAEELAAKLQDVFARKFDEE
ncbi:HPr family phosphocarrier protein [Chlamydiifrater phoenicopteri]|uniref:HPr family phosphocarrier protein n=1 Tax=Chlamydiifrater phoenicopteri TaxID=2681469 RepID=UPI001BD0842E|nr:HPr family phosphocarrier protein [Chlamydiifrater phoenicopteri]